MLSTDRAWRDARFWERADSSTVRTVERPVQAAWNGAGATGLESGERHHIEIRVKDRAELCYILCVMDRVGVRELRQNLSVYLRRVRRGEKLEVTERGRPVAVLQPIMPADDPLVRLEARGIHVRRGAGNLADLPPPASVRLDRPLSDVLDESREDRI